LIKENKGWYVMKFLLIVLAIHLVGELISTKRKDNKNNKAEMMDNNVHHPAENELR
jgi:hypothetical protein